MMVFLILACLAQQPDICAEVGHGTAASKEDCEQAVAIMTIRMQRPGFEIKGECRKDPDEH